ncbi:MAG TPA: Na+/H+ antiporter subunit E [Kiritimatiellia bacterium]|nr:Na+/H+ antiporter subunit E [Kiritimatiellia bacterium]
MRTETNNPIPAAGAFLRRLATLILLWWVLDEGRADGWWFGGFIIAGALLARPLFHLEKRAWRCSLPGLMRFIPFFLKLSIHGGWDVARRAFQRRMPLEPTLFDYHARIANPTARIFFTHVISLLPGTLSTDLRGSALQIHALFGSPDELLASTTELETRVADLFGEHPPGTGARA